MGTEDPQNQQNTTEETTQLTSDNDSQYKLVDRITTSYPVVNTAIETAKGYYDAAKDSSTLVKRVAETVESGVSTTLKTVQPYLENERVVPILTSLDNLGMNQLDKIEKTVETYQPTVTAVAENLKSKANSVVDTSVQTITATDKYLRDSYLAAPVNIAVGVSENILNRYIPEDKKEAESDDEAGPIFRSGKIAMRLQKEALVRLSNLSLRDKATTQGYAYVIDLIQYAVSNLDNTIHAVNHTVEATHKYANSVQSTVQDTLLTSVETSKEKAKLVLENERVQQTKAQVEQRYHDAMTALAKALEALQKNAPENVQDATIAVYDMTKNFAQQLDEKNMALYSAVATKGAERLRSLNVDLQTKLKDATDVSAAALDNARTTVANVLDSLVRVRKGELSISDIVTNTTTIPSVSKN